MDELLIEEKKYISSKQAAKITGYAKDYIGQLCREGRVPARLVGRSWYVLETAIQDHRFGDTSDESTKSKKEAIRSDSPIKASLSTWEAPRYEASSVETFPPLERLQDTEIPVPVDIQREPEVSQDLQDSWRAWFDRIEPVIPDEVPPTEPEKVEMEEAGGNDEVDIPIHSIYKALIAESLPDVASVPESSAKEEQFMYEEKRRGRRPITAPIQLVGAFFALVIAIIALISTGYFDTYIISNSQARIIAGVALYNK